MTESRALMQPPKPPTRLPSAAELYTAWQAELAAKAAAVVDREQKSGGGVAQGSPAPPPDILWVIATYLRSGVDTYVPEAGPAAGERGGDVELIELVAHREELGRVAAAARSMQRDTDEVIGAELGRGGAIRWGATLLRWRQSSRVVVQDSETWWAWLTRVLRGVPEWQAHSVLSALYPADALRSSAIGALADAAVMELEVVRDTFLARRYDRIGLESLPETRWPTWARKLADGEVHRGT